MQPPLPSAGIAAAVLSTSLQTGAGQRGAGDLLASITLEEKSGQMTQADSGSLSDPADVARLLLGSVLSGGDSEPRDVSARGWRSMVETYEKQALTTRLRIPIIHGIDAVHGHSNVRGATIFPHNIGLGCARNPQLVEHAARITAPQGAASGIHWDFAACHTLPQADLEGR